MKIKTEFVGDDWGFYVIKDETQLYKDIVKFDGQAAANDYFTEGEFEPNDTSGYAIVQLESLGQSDNCPPQLYTNDFKIIITILGKEESNTLFAIHENGELYLPKTGIGIVNVRKSSNKKVSKLYHSKRNAIIAAKNIPRDVNSLTIVPYGPIGKPIQIKEETD